MNKIKYDYNRNSRLYITLYIGIYEKTIAFEFVSYYYRFDTNVQSTQFIKKVVTIDKYKILQKQLVARINAGDYKVLNIPFYLDIAPLYINN